MRELLNSRPSPAMVVACIALIVALGGTSYAALKLPRNSVGNKQLKSNAVTGAKVRNGTLTAKDFRASALKRGPRGPQGPMGESVGAIPRTGYASRDPYKPGGSRRPVAVGAGAVDLIGLDVRAGTSDYTSSSGRVTASGPSRLVANGQAVILNAGAANGDVNCRIVLVGTDARVIGNDVNALVGAGGAYYPVAVSAGSDIDAGSYDVRLQCSSGAPSLAFHRGNLAVAIAPR
jgi:hypothetical protein